MRSKDCNREVSKNFGKPINSHLQEAPLSKKGKLDRGQQNVDMNEWLMNNATLVTVTRPRGGGTLSRAMAFVYEVLPSGRVVICTCRHNFLEVNDLSSFTFLGGFNREEQFVPLHPMPMYAPDGRDISFIVTRRVTMAKKLRAFDTRAFDKWHANDEGILYNCRNAIGEQSNTQLFVARQTIGPPNKPGHRAWISAENAETAHMLPEDDTVELPGLRERGYIEHGYMRMLTRPGFSGSPIWDDQLRLIGMNIRGTYGGDDGDYCGYVYAGDLRRTFDALRPQMLEIDRNSHVRR